MELPRQSMVGWRPLIGAAPDAQVFSRARRGDAFFIFFLYMRRDNQDPWKMSLSITSMIWRQFICLDL